MVNFRNSLPCCCFDQGDCSPCDDGTFPRFIILTYTNNTDGDDPSPTLGEPFACSDFDGTYVLTPRHLFTQCPPQVRAQHVGGFRFPVIASDDEYYSEAAILFKVTWNPGSSGSGIYQLGIEVELGFTNSLGGDIFYHLGKETYATVDEGEDFDCSAIDENATWVNSQKGTPGNASGACVALTYAPYNQTNSNTLHIETTNAL